MIKKEKIIDSLFNLSSHIRYVALYEDNYLLSKQKEELYGNSSPDTDKYEELIVNPSILTLARQRGNIDCGGLRFIIIGYGNFYQLITEIKGGHISVCLDINADLTKLSDKIFSFLKNTYSIKFTHTINISNNNH